MRNKLADEVEQFNKDLAENEIFYQKQEQKFEEQDKKLKEQEQKLK